MIKNSNFSINSIPLHKQREHQTEETSQKKKTERNLVCFFMASFSGFLPLLMLFVFGIFSCGTAQDFCVADLGSEITPSGYPCKKTASLSGNDFAFSGLRNAGNVTNAISAAVTPAFSPQFPAVNGLGISIARLDLAPNGVIPFHTHPAASEILIVIQGIICAGFVSTDNVVYTKSLYKGDVMVFPQGLLHFQINGGGTNALAFASFSSPLPGLQITAFTLFANDLPKETVEKTTFISQMEVARLKALLGGK